MHVFEERQWFNQWWILLLHVFLAGMLLFFLYTWYIAKTNVNNVDADDYAGQALVIGSLLFAFVLLFIFRLKTSIDENGVHFQLFPIQLKRKSISWYDIEKCYTRKYKPLGEYGGWGYRVSRSHGNAYNVKGNMGIQLELKSGKEILIGTQRPDDAKNIIDRYFKRK